MAYRIVFQFGPICRNLLPLGGACLLLAVCGCGIGSDEAQAGYREAARYSAKHRGIAMVVMVDGKVVFEDYPRPKIRGRRLGGRGFAVELRTGTRSFWGVAAAAAVQDGLLNLDEKVSATLPEWRDDTRRDITLRDLLTLTSGIRGRRPMDWTLLPPTFADAVRAQPLTAAGEQFFFSDIPFQIFGEVLRRKLTNGESPVHYLKRRVLDPIGVTYKRWRRGPDGNAFMPWGAYMTARNWARFGEFVRLGGRRKGRQLVDPAALEACFRGTKANPAYGLTWWLNHPVPDHVRNLEPLRSSTDLPSDNPAVPKDLVFTGAAGYMRLYISRSRRMVVVRHAWHPGGFSDVAFWQALTAED